MQRLNCGGQRLRTGVFTVADEDTQRTRRQTLVVSRRLSAKLERMLNGVSDPPQRPGHLCPAAAPDEFQLAEINFRWRSGQRQRRNLIAELGDVQQKAICMCSLI